MLGIAMLINLLLMSKSRSNHPSRATGILSRSENGLNKLFDSCNVDQVRPIISINWQTKCANPGEL